MILLLAACAPPPPPNILLVSLDTVRYSRTSLGGARDTTPNLAALARRGVVYDAAYAVGNESLYSHATLLTGRYASEVAAPDYASFSVPKGTPTLPRVLSAYGYTTAAFTGGGHVVAAFGFDEGFDTFTAAPGAARFASLYDSVPPAVAWIAAQPGPWFAFVHGYDAHAPYVQPGPFRHAFGADGMSARIEAIAGSDVAIEQIQGDTWYPTRQPLDFVHASGRTILSTSFYRAPATPRPGEHVERLTEAEVRHLRDHYDTGVLYGDLWLGLLLAHIDLSTTLVIVVADHGEDLLEHGWMNHRAGLWDSTTHVPLVVAGPGFPAGERRTGMVDLRAVAPTAWVAAGATFPAGTSGRALQGGEGAEAVFAEGVMGEVSVRTADHRLVVHDAGLLDADPAAAIMKRSLVDGGVSLWSTADDTRDLLAGSPDPGTLALAEELRARIVAWRRGIPARAPGTPPTPALRKALQERGYWTPTGPSVP